MDRADNGGSAIEVVLFSTKRNAKERKAETIAAFREWFRGDAKFWAIMESLPAGAIQCIAENVAGES